MSRHDTEKAVGPEPLLQVEVRRADFDPSLETAQLMNALAQAGADADIGAMVTFVGLCRSEEGRLAALELEYYPEMAERQMRRIAETATRRWPLAALSIVHRHGVIRPGERIVLVITVARHRMAAFEAANFTMDFLKTNAPFWKKEHLAGGASGGWITAAADDETAAARWTGTPITE